MTNFYTKIIDMKSAQAAVEKICAAIDAGQIKPTELEMMALALLVNEKGGFLKHDLLCQLASRSEIGRKALKDVAQ